VCGAEHVIASLHHQLHLLSQSAMLNSHHT
jgi:hypothetical protein